MTLSTNEIGNLYLADGSPPARSVRKYCGPNHSLRQAFWCHRRTRLATLFDGGTPVEQEDEALRILLSADSAAETRHYLRELTWDAFDDDLEEQRMTEWAQHVGIRHAQAENRVARFVLASVGPVAGLTLDEVRTRYAAVWSGLSRARRRALARALADDRMDLIGSAIRCELMDRSAHLDAFRALLEVMAADADIVTDGLRMTLWQAFYARRFAEQFHAGEVGLLMTLLADLVDPDLPDIRRQALFELYRMHEPTMHAVRTVIGQLGNADLVVRYQRFLEAWATFRDNFPQSEPPPGLFARLMAALGEVGSELRDLRALLGRIAADLTGFTLEGLLNGTSDDDARNAINELASNDLGWLPFTMRAELCRRCLVGSTDDDDEQAIRRVLANTHRGSLAERFLLVSVLTWEALDASFDGDEYDRLEELLTRV